jgi:hypothetical protein
MLFQALFATRLPTPFLGNFTENGGKWQKIDKNNLKHIRVYLTVFQYIVF